MTARTAIDDIAPSAATPEARLLLQGSAAAILKRPPPPCPPGIRWDEFVRAGERNRLLLLAGRALPTDAPDSVRVAIERYRALTLGMNGANLRALRIVAAALDQAGLDAVALKGPTAQFGFYGDYFIKPSTDVDLLVAPRDFSAARRVISQCGYARADACASPWWRVFLGEEHLLSQAPGGIAVDLHHRLQQPGCPAPRQRRAFLRDRRSHRLGETSIQVLTPRAALLLACMSMVKGIVHREATGGYVSDIAAAIANASPAEIEEFTAFASALGLTNTLYTGLHAAQVLFGVRAAIPDARRFDLCGDADLIALVLAPESLAHPPRRTRMLADLCENAWDFGRELAWKISADTLRAPLNAISGALG